MDRRTFLKCCAAGGAMAPSLLASAAEDAYTPPDIFPSVIELALDLVQAAAGTRLEELPTNSSTSIVDAPASTGTLRCKLRSQRFHSLVLFLRLDEQGIDGTDGELGVGRNPEIVGCWSAEFGCRLSQRGLDTEWLGVETGS